MINSEFSLQSIETFILEKKDIAKHTRFALGLATTSSVSKDVYFSYPRYIQNWGYYFHLICTSTEDAINSITYLHSHINLFFLDVENKNKNFSASKIKEENKILKFKYIYPNNLTLLTCMDSIDIFGHQPMLIFGHGNLAFRLAVGLKEANINFYWCASRDSSSAKFRLMKSSFPEQQVDYVDSNIKLFLNLSAYESSFYEQLTEFPQIKIIDVAAKGSLGSKFKSRVKNVDISDRLVSEVGFLIHHQRGDNNFGRSTFNEKYYCVSGGYLGSKGDLVVDNHINPTFVIGIADGQGGFSKRINKSISNYLK